MLFKSPTTLTIHHPLAFLKLPEHILQYFFFAPLIIITYFVYSSLLEALILLLVLVLLTQVGF